MTLSAIKSFWKKSRFLRDVAKVSTGKLSAMLIGVVAAPVISRLFDPSDYGIAALFIATIAISASILPLAYDRALIYPKKDSEASRLLVLALSVSVGLIFVAYIAIAISVLLWPDISGHAGLGAYIWLLPLGALLLSWRNTAVALCIRREDFTSIASADLTEAASSASTKIVWGLLLTSSVSGLILGNLLGVVIAALICSVRCLPWLKISLAPINFEGLRSIAIEHRDYAFFRAPARVTFTAAMQLPVIALGFLFPAEIVGFYAMANRAVGRPLQAASTAITNVLLGKMMGLRRIDQPLGESFMKVVMFLVLTGIPIFSLIFIYGEEILSWLLGGRWATAGNLAEILAPYLFVLWAGGSVSATIFETLRLNKLRLMINAGSLLTRVATFVACGIANLGITDTLSVFVIISSAYRMLTYAIAAIVIARHDAEILRKNAHPASGND